jgi:hypothetical protein
MSESASVGLFDGLGAVVRSTHVLSTPTLFQAQLVPSPVILALLGG